MEGEIFRDIEGYEGLYQVSNFGNVLSLRSGINLKAVKGPGGRLIVGLTLPVDRRKSRYCGHKTFTTYLLVAKAFPEICGKWFEGCEIHHKDGNYLNNRADNLECLSKEEHHNRHWQKKKKVFHFMFS